MNALKVLSLFSGIGGLELGLERAGMTVAGQVEIDPYCQQVLETHWPEVPRHDDVLTAPEWWQSQARPRIDTVAGRFPCQPFSIAGEQLGIDDPRWMWPAFADVVRVVRPRYVIVENVAALVRDRDAFSWVLSDLHQLGFDAEWTVVGACAVGAPHRRRRLFLVAYPRGTRLPGLHRTRRQIDLQPAQRDLRRHWQTEPDVDRVAYGVPRRLVVDPLRALGNAVVPQLAEHIGRLITGHRDEASATTPRLVTAPTHHHRERSRP
ncbi:DNA cytosine methyltransferase [Lentzea sp. NPDC058450]|uniref:DNA cytosine methyltransferase n=1 Tax=Lentzea sp. NPDC058450 TaxID=3346505 RepID=UPI003647FACE